MSLSIANKIVSCAAARIGEGEVPPGSNRGPLPDKALRYVYGAAVNLDKLRVDDRQWCAAFACLCKRDALEALSMPDNTLRTASTGGIRLWGEAEGRIVTSPQAGDFGLVRDASSPTGYKHTVIVEAVIGQIVHTLEGNEANQVRRNTRTLASMDYVRPY